MGSKNQYKSLKKEFPNNIKYTDSNVIFHKSYNTLFFVSRQKDLIKENQPLHLWESMLLNKKIIYDTDFFKESFLEEYDLLIQNLNKIKHLRFKKIKPKYPFKDIIGA